MPQSRGMEYQARGIAPARFAKSSLIHLDPAVPSKIPADVLVYGRNGVQPRPVEGAERELGIIVETTAKTREAAVLLASLLTHYLIHYGYPGRKATAGAFRSASGC